MVNRQSVIIMVFSCMMSVSSCTNTLFLYIRMLFFRARLNILIFLPILAWKYSCIILEIELKKKEFIIFLLRFVHCFWLYTIDMYISCTVHRTVISTEHLAITNAGFFVLLDSFAVGGSNNSIRLKTYFFRFSSLKIIILFEISASGLFLKYS